MKRNWKVLIVTVFLIALTACAPDPRRDASAQATVIKAQQDAQVSDQALKIETAEADQALAMKQAADAEKQARAAWWKEVRESATTAAKVGMNIVAVCMALSVCVMLYALARTVKETSVGLGRVLVQAAEVRAGLIHMDAKTRTFPALVDVRQTHGDRFVAMLADGQVLKLNASNPSDRQKVAALGLTSALGAWAQEARLSQDPTGMAQVNLPVVSSREKALFVGAEFVENFKMLLKGEEE